MAQNNFFDNLNTAMKNLEQARQNGIISIQQEEEHLNNMLSMYDAINAKKAAGREWDLKTQSIWGNLKRFGKEMADDAENLKKAKKSLKRTEDEINKLAEAQDKLSKKGNQAAADMVKKKKEQLAIEKEIQEVNYETAKSSVSRMGKAFNMMGKVGGFMSSNFGFLGSIFKGILGTVWDIAKGIFDIIFPIEKAWKLFLELQKAVGNLSADIGMTYNEYKNLLKEGTSIYNEIIGYGGKIEDIAKVIRGFSEETGKNRIFSKEEITDIVKLGYSTGLAVEGVTKMVAEFDNLGYSLGTTMKVAEKGRNVAARFNLNQTKVLRTTTDVVKNLTGTAFGRSVEDLTKLAAKAETLRFNLAESIKSFKDSFFSPEKAVESAAKIQVLGGEFAQMFGDPFQLMYDSMNNADGMAEKLINSAKGLAVKNKNGEFIIPPAQRQILRETAESLGQDYDSIVNAAIEQAKIGDKMIALTNAGVSLGGFNEEDRMSIANLMTMNKNGQYEIKMANGVNQLLSNITSEDQLKNVLSQRKANEQAAQQRLNLSERFQIVLDRFAIGLMPIFQKLNEYLEDEGTLQRIEKLGKTIADVMIPAVENLFAPGGFLDSAIKFFLNDTNKFLDDLQGIMSGKGPFFEKMVNVFSKVVDFTANTILPYVRIAFAEIFKSLKDLPGVGDAFLSAALQLELNDEKTASVAKKLGINNQGLIQEKIGNVREHAKYQGMGDAAGGLFSGLGNIVGGAAEMVGGLIPALWGNTDYLTAGTARVGIGGARTIDALGASMWGGVGSGSLENKIIDNALSGNAPGGGAWARDVYDMEYLTPELQRSANKPVKVQDAMVYANGQYIKGGKGDAVAFLDELAFGQAYKNAMGGGNDTTVTVNVSGTIEHDSEDGRRVVTAEELYKYDPQMFGRLVETSLQKYDLGGNSTINFGVTPIGNVS